MIFGFFLIYCKCYMISFHLSLKPIKFANFNVDFIYVLNFNIRNINNF